MATPLRCMFGTAQRRVDAITYLVGGDPQMHMKQGEQYTCNQCGCDVTVTVAPSVAGKGGQGSLVCCGEKMSMKSHNAT